MKIYALKDNKIGFIEAFVKTNNAVAIRTFQDTIQDTRSLMYKHKDDFSVYFIAEINDETGMIVSAEPVKLLDGSEVAVLKNEKE